MLRGVKAQGSAHSAARTDRKARQKQVHLSKQRKLELVDRYRAGASRRELSEAIGVHRAMAAATLKRHDAHRQRGLSPPT